MNQAQINQPQAETAPNAKALTFYLLSIQGTLAAPTVEAARAIHNSTAGEPNNVAAAQALGDLSHMVYVPLPGFSPQPQSGAGDFLILDVWDSLEGINQFFANPNVQHQAGQIFAVRDPVVWLPAEGFLGYNLPAPYGQNERIVAVVRGKVRSHAQGMAAHNAIVSSQMTNARRAGDIIHQAYLRLAPPNSPEALEFFAIDVWLDAERMGNFYANPGFQQALGTLFAEPPATSIWTHPAGNWVEW